MNSIPHQTSHRKLHLSQQQREKRSERAKEQRQKQYQADIEAYDANPNRCLYCQKPIPRREGVWLCEIKQKKYCSQSCAARNTNHVAPKRVKTMKPCKSCGMPIPRLKNSLCKPCLTAFNARLANKTKAECDGREIRNHGRSVMNGIPKICSHCEWSKFVEVCHIRAIKNFPSTATVAEINDPANLIYLCPNCHWEFDHPSSR